MFIFLIIMIVWYIVMIVLYNHITPIVYQLWVSLKFVIKLLPRQAKNKTAV